MTPSFWDDEQILLRAQLKCLSLQTCKDFDLWLIDPHYQKRKNIIPELAAKFRLDIKHVPYAPNTRIAKHYDCAIFNAPYCYSKARIIARYSCYRFARPTFIEAIAGLPDGVNADFYMHAVGHDISVPGVDVSPEAKHRLVWDFNSEDYNWDLVPVSSGYDDNHKFCGDPSLCLGNWPKFMDKDAPPAVVPLNIYGNIAWRRDQWMQLNGTNEVITNASHWEDLDFDCRAQNAKQMVARFAHLLYRHFHYYGKLNQRSTIPVDVPFKPFCDECRKILIDNGGDVGFGHQVNMGLKSFRLRHYYQHRAWVCSECLLSGPVYDETGLDHYFFHLQDMGITRAPILSNELIGRNLLTVANEMDKVSSLSSKVDIYNDSWVNPKFYNQ